MYKRCGLICAAFLFKIFVNISCQNQKNVVYLHHRFETKLAS